ncbi:MAG: cupin domain-containing protein [Rariglobus sp.]
MNTNDYTASSNDTWLLTRKILTESGVDAAITLIGPGVETPPSDHPAPRPIVLLVSEGAVTASVDRTHFILRKDEALHVAPGKIHTLRNHTDAPAKVVAITLPAPRRENPPLVVGFP